MQENDSSLFDLKLSSRLFTSNLLKDIEHHTNANAQINSCTNSNTNLNMISNSNTNTNKIETKEPNTINLKDIKEKIKSIDGLIKDASSKIKNFRDNTPNRSNYIHSNSNIAEPKKQSNNNNPSALEQNPQILNAKLNEKENEIAFDIIKNNLKKPEVNDSIEYAHQSQNHSSSSKHIHHSIENNDANFSQKYLKKVTLPLQEKQLGLNRISDGSFFTKLNDTLGSKVKNLKKVEFNDPIMSKLPASVMSKLPISVMSKLPESLTNEDSKKMNKQGMIDYITREIENIKKYEDSILNDSLNKARKEYDESKRKLMEEYESKLRMLEDDFNVKMEQYKNKSDERVKDRIECLYKEIQNAFISSFTNFTPELKPLNNNNISLLTNVTRDTLTTSNNKRGISMDSKLTSPEFILSNKNNKKVDLKSIYSREYLKPNDNDISISNNHMEFISLISTKGFSEWNTKANTTISAAAGANTASIGSNGLKFEFPNKDINCLGIK